MKSIFLFATVASFVGLAGCAVGTNDVEGHSEPVDVAIEGDGETTSNYYQSRRSVCPNLWGPIYGVSGFYVGPPPTESDCTSMCNNQCGKPSGWLRFDYWSNTFYCTCY